MKPYTLSNRAYILLSTIAVLLLWGIIASLVDNPVKIPSPLETLKALKIIVTDDVLYPNTDVYKEIFNRL